MCAYTVSHVVHLVFFSLVLCSHFYAHTKKRNRFLVGHNVCAQLRLAYAFGTVDYAMAAFHLYLTMLGDQ